MIFRWPHYLLVLLIFAASDGYAGLYWKVSLGYRPDGGMAGRLVLESESPGVEVYSPSALKLVSASGSRLIDRGGGCRQILTKEAFVVVETTSRQRYEIRFYEPDGARFHPSGEDGVADAFFTIEPGKTPYTVYTVENPDDSDVCKRLRITKSSPNRRDQSTVYGWGPELFTVYTEGEGSVILTTHTNGTAVVKCWTYADAAGEINSIERKVYKRGNETSLPGQDLLLLSKLTIEHPNGAHPRTNIVERFDTPTDLGRTKKVVCFDGQWETYRYFSTGEISEKNRGGSHSPTQTFLYTYKPVLPPNRVPDGMPIDDGSVESLKPRVETFLTNGVIASTILRHIAVDTKGRTIIEEVELSQPAETNLVEAWFASGNLRRHLRSIPDFNHHNWWGEPLPELIVDADGSRQEYAYSQGYLVHLPDGSPGKFMPREDGMHLCKTMTLSPGAGGSATFRLVSVYKVGSHDPLQEEVFLTDGTNGLKRVYWCSYTYDKAGRAKSARTWGDEQFSVFSLTNLYPSIQLSK